MTETIFERLKWLETGALALGLLALVGASQFEREWLYTTCMLAFGLGLSLSGLGALFTRRVRVLEFFREGNPDLGPAAIPWGFVTFLAGLTLLAFGLLRTAGLDGRFLAYLGRQPAPVLALAGLALAGIGSGMLLGPPDWNATVWRLLLHLPLRLVGAGLLLLGIGLLGLSMFDFVAPAAFDRWIQAVLGPFSPR